MTTQPATAPSYDEVLYPSDPLPLTHPDRLATVARLFGLQTPPIDRCRVLELGCGTGGNLFPMADRHPQSTFVGVDLSLRQVRAAREMVEVLGLENIRFEQISIQDVGEELGQFDYIIAHGVFSWVTHDLQEKILSICSTLLSRHGVAYLSYNAYPAWHLRSVFRELAQNGTSIGQSYIKRVGELRRSLEFLSGALDDEVTPYSRFVRDDIEFVLSQPDNYLVHEYLEDENNPLYFHEFAERAAAHRLQYLGDAIIPMMFAATLGPTVEQNLAPYAGDLTNLEQHMDALWNRSLRNTLLCHAGVPISRQINSANFGGLYFAGELRPERARPALATTTSEKFFASNGAALSTESPTAKAVLYELGARWPGAVSLDELISAATARLRSQGRLAEFSSEERRAVGDYLLQCLVAGIVEARSAPDSFVVTLSPNPRASRVALFEARTTPRVANRRHEVVLLDEVSQNMLAHLDGRHDRQALRRILRDAMDNGRLSILRDGIPIRRGEAADEILERALEQSLSTLARQALLVA
jgi:methyltransferase-like protein/ubiquinone/menaquinone biosynthesis C-methylase UbiE